MSAKTLTPGVFRMSGSSPQLATLGVMLAGMLGLVRSDGNAGRSNTLMRWRVVLQGVTLALFALLLLVMRH